MSDFDAQKFAERLGTLRKAKGLRQTEIAKAFDISKQLVNAWEHGRNLPTLQHLIELSRLYGMTVDALLTGGELPEQTVRQLYQSTVMGTTVQLCTEPEIRHLARHRNVQMDKKNWVKSKISCSKRSIAFHIFDRSMMPTFAGEDLVVVDPMVQPQPGDCIAVVLGAEDRAVFRRYRPARDGLKIEPPYDLRSDNPDFPTIAISRSDEPIFVGTLVEHTKFGPSH